LLTHGPALPGFHEVRLRSAAPSKTNGRDNGPAMTVLRWIEPALLPAATPASSPA
jgi:hypothetical protein